LPPARAPRSIDVRSDDYITPVRWDDWLKLPVREHDNAVNTPRGPVRVPTVIVAANSPKCRCAARSSAPAAFGSAMVASANTPAGSFRQKKATSTTSSRAPAAAKPPGDNCVLAHREINQRKADRLPQEVGLRLRKQPCVPRALPTSAFIRNHHGVADWEHFPG
jgi:hypothetical protein